MARLGWSLVVSSGPACGVVEPDTSSLGAAWPDTRFCQGGGSSVRRGTALRFAAVRTTAVNGALPHPRCSGKSATGAAVFAELRIWAGSAQFRSGPDRGGPDPVSALS